MAVIRLDLLGGFQARPPAGEAIAISSKKGRALLAYLALHARPQSRERLSGLLWSAREQAQAFNSLRHELMALRRAFGALDPPPLAIDGDTVAFVADAVETDVAAFERCAAGDDAEALRAAAGLYRGTLLAGLSIRDEVFEEWLSQERTRLHELAIGVLDRLAIRSSGAAALAAARRLLALDPLREASHRALMRASAEQGETDLALRQFEACRDLLRDELAVAPAVETERLHQEIRAGKLTPRIPAAAQASAEPDKPSLAVMPFDVFGDDAGLQSLAAGLVGDITTGMARFRVVSVVSRHAASAHRERAVELRRLGRGIGASYVLAGSLRRSGERLRATAQLVETETGRELWAERYDRDLAEPFAIQDELSQAIVAAIEHVLVAAEHRRGIGTAGGEDLSLSRRAGWHLFRLTREDNATAIALLRQAIAENPSADRRHQGLALALGLDLAFGWTDRPEETIAAMVAAAERGVSLGEADAWNHAPLSWALLFARQFDRAIAGLGRMVELNPNSGVTYGVSALVLGHGGSAEAALAMLATARQLAPQAPFMFNYLVGGAIALYRLGRYGEAAGMAESAALRRPNFFQPPLVQAAALARAGQPGRAAAPLASAQRLAPDLSARWLAPLLPLREAADLADVIDGLRQAGWKE